MAQYKWRIGAYRQDLGSVDRTPTNPKKVAGGQRSTGILQQEVLGASASDIDRLAKDGFWPGCAAVKPTNAVLGSNSPVSNDPTFNVETSNRQVLKLALKSRKSIRSSGQSVSRYPLKRIRSTPASCTSSFNENEIDEDCIDMLMAKSQSNVLNALASCAMTPKTVTIYLDMIKPNASITHEVFNVSPIYTWDFTSDAQHGFVFHSASSVVQSMHDARLSAPFKREPSKEALQHKSRALMALRDELASCEDTVSDQLLLAVLECLPKAGIEIAGLGMPQV